MVTWSKRSLTSCTGCSRNITTVSAGSMEIFYIMVHGKPVYQRSSAHAGNVGSHGSLVCEPLQVHAIPYAERLSPSLL
jgi:hypothetical protein